MSSYYIRDLVNRQNRSLTEAQKDSIINARRYTMDEINDTTKKLGDKTYQIDLETNPLYSFIHPNKVKECELRQDIRNELKEEIEEELNNEITSKLKIQEAEKQEMIKNFPQDVKRLKNKFILLDPIRNGHNMTFKLKNDLLPDLIDGFLWIKVWMEYNKYDIMNALGMDGKAVLISKQEIDTVISTFKNLDRIVQDK